MTRLLPALMLAGCLGSAEGVRVLGPEAIDIRWDEEGEGIVAVVPVDLLAYSATDGAALPGEVLRVRVHGGGLAVPEDLIADGPLWDSYGARPIDLADVSEERVLATDDLGALRVLVVLERFEQVDGCAEPAELVVDAADAPADRAPLVIPIAPRVPCR